MIKCHSYVVVDLVNSGYSPGVFFWLTMLSIIFAVLVIVIRNPVISVLFLIGLFFCIAGYLIAVGIWFIGLSYLLVYVGAVSILFLFILMLINIRISELTSETKNSIPLVIIVTVLFENASYVIFQKSLLYNNNISILNITTSNDWESITEFSHINSIGNTLYSTDAIFLLLISVILLLAMVGAIVITIKQKKLDYEIVK